MAIQTRTHVQRDEQVREVMNRQQVKTCKYPAAKQEHGKACGKLVIPTERPMRS